MNGTEITILILALLCIILFWAMLVWPAALILTFAVVVCVWASIFDGGQPWICDQMPNDPYCVEKFK